MEMIAEFERDVMAGFGFLKNELGYEADGVSMHMPEISAQFHNQTTEVTIIYEIGSAPWVRLGNRRQRSEPDFSLELLIEERSPKNLAFSCEAAEPGTEVFRACLKAKAEALRNLGSDVLRGDFGILPKMRVRLKENEERRNRELFGNLGQNARKGT